MRRSLPLSSRPLDVALIAFFAVNLCFTTYVVSLEQLVIADPARFTPPAWPPERLLALVHWWERSFDPLLLARPAWYRATIWLDVLVFGPFYAVAIYAFARGRDWIRRGRSPPQPGLSHRRPGCGPLRIGNSLNVAAVGRPLRSPGPTRCQART